MTGGAGGATAAGAALGPWGAAIGAVIDVAGAALGGPPPSSTALGGNTSLGPNNVTYNKGPSNTMMIGIGAAVLVLWLWNRKRKR
mgnify:CR=1 FL=1